MRATVATWPIQAVFSSEGVRRAARGLQGNVRVTVRAFLMPQIGFAGQGGLIYTILVAVGGAVVLTGVVRVLKRA
jgi:uncharacterized membrane protein YeaQ/YmgE (transglycosylase-associated protein family)